jgi:hypothetical protein
MKHDRGSVAIVLVNLVPLIGILFEGWSIFYVMFIFWFENVVIGIFNIFKMWIRGMVAERAKAVFLPIFFFFHYGIFTTVHGVFVFALFGSENNTESLPASIVDGMVSLPLIHTYFPIMILYSMGILAFMHSLSFIFDYIGREEYKQTTMEQLMFQPYKRIIVLHVVLIFGGILIQSLGAPIMAVILLIVLKLIFDLRSYATHRQSFQPVAVL